jgi:hypothetical protein
MKTIVETTAPFLGPRTYTGEVRLPYAMVPTAFVERKETVRLG